MFTGNWTNPASVSIDELAVAVASAEMFRPVIAPLIVMPVEAADTPTVSISCAVAASVTSPAL